MSTWHELGTDNRTSSNELFALKRWRSCASRAYYALYSEITHALRQAGVQMPAGQENPRHKTLPLLIGNNLHLLRIESRWRLAGILAKLYTFRVIADYLPSVTLDEEDARIAMGLMTQGFVLLVNAP